MSVLYGSKDVVDALQRMGAPNAHPKLWNFDAVQPLSQIPASLPDKKRYVASLSVDGARVQVCDAMYMEMVRWIASWYVRMIDECSPKQRQEMGFPLAAVDREATTDRLCAAGLTELDRLIGVYSTLFQPFSVFVTIEDSS